MAKDTKTAEYPVVWLQGAGCSGCSVSVLNSVSPKISNVLIDEVVPGKHVSMRFHATIMAGSGEMALKVLPDTKKEFPGKYILILEGAIPTADKGVYCEVGDKALLEVFKDLAKDALAVIALGECAAFGGIPAAEPNPTGCKGAMQVLKESKLDVPIINIPGCPPHPDWFVGTVACVLLNGLDIELDGLARPRLFYGGLIHENCPRRPDFDKGKFAEKLGDDGCLYELGCKGPYTSADCPERQFNSGINWCIKNGSPCHGCVEPEFPDGLSPLYKKLK